MSGQWQPYKQENEIEQQSTEVAQSLEAETEDGGSIKPTLLAYRVVAARTIKGHLDMPASD
jgi:hypothetical protein